MWACVGGGGGGVRGSVGRNWTGGRILNSEPSPPRILRTYVKQNIWPHALFMPLPPPPAPPRPLRERLIVYSILFYPITLLSRWGTTDDFETIPFHLVLFSAALVELAKSIPVHSLILSSHLFFCLPLLLFPFTVPCRIVFAKPEDIETWPNHLSFRFLTSVRSSSFSNGCLDLSANLLIGYMVLVRNVQ